MRTQKEKAHTFAAMHRREVAFIIPNPWDPGTARLLARLGFEALATTSGGYAFSMGKRDHAVGRDEMLAHAAAIVSATDLPVSADLESGYGRGVKEIAETYRRAGAVGLVGASIEDGTERPDRPIFELSEAVERVSAAAESVRGLSFPFVLTARTENFLCGRPDLDDTIRRLQAYQEAGADVLYAPGLTTREQVSAVVRAVDRPVNVLMGLRGVQLSLAELSSLGVRRVSVGSALARAALGAFQRAAHEMNEQGTFGFADQALPYPEINLMFDP